MAKSTTTKQVTSEEQNLFEDLASPKFNIDLEEKTRVLKDSVRIDDELRSRLETNINNKGKRNATVSEYTTYLSPTSNAQEVVFPNQYYAIAALYFDFAMALKKYCDFYDQKIKKDRKKIEELKQCQTEEQTHELLSSFFDSKIDAQNFISFWNTDYIENQKKARNAVSEKTVRSSKDLFVSHILKKLGVSNSSANSLGDIIYYLTMDSALYSELRDLFFWEKERLRPKGVQKSYKPLQRIIFGAPGTGKSHKIDYDLFKNKNGDTIGKGLKEIPEKRKFRTTFHPDYDYAQFVGAYKPQENSLSNNLSKKELVKKLNKMKDSETNAVHIFSALYSDSLLKLSSSERVSVIVGAGVPNSMKREMAKGIAVGQYLKNEMTSTSITYSFVPQVFAKAYATAWKLLLNNEQDENVYLVIEEINRGNCAQIFGDIFQLLDRDDEGFSQYSIDADCDFVKWLKTDKEYGLKTVWEQYISFHYERDKKNVNPVSETKIALPPNFNILATMNTSDQSLFPMDSAFKRRFDWEYVPIKYEAEKNVNGKKKDENWKADEFKISFECKEGDEVKNYNFYWLHFLKKINADIYKVTESEDKQMGEFFIKPKKDMDITSEEFCSKVLFYLWDSIYKDCPNEKNFFNINFPENSDSTVTFQRLFKDDFGIILKKMLETLDTAYNAEEYKDFKIFSDKN